MRALMVMVVVVVTVAGCERKKVAPEPTYQGRPLSTWIAETNDADPPTRVRAYEAILGIRHPRPDVRAALYRGEKDADQDARKAAAWATLHVYAEPGPLTRVARDELVALAKDPESEERAVDLKITIQELGPHAKPMKKELDTLHEKLRGRPKQKVYEAIAAIPR